MPNSILEPRLAGKVALVTGAARGIGREIALRLAREGAAVGVLDLKAELAEDTVDTIVQAGGRARAFAGNVAERQSLVDAVAALEADYGRFDILVNNAIWVRYGPLESITQEALDRMLATGFSSIVWGMQAAAPAMVRAGGGSIINIASVAGYLAMPGALVYCGVKAGVMGLTRSASAELGPQGIRVNAIAPGSVPTPGVAVNVDETKMQGRIERTPLRRLGRVQDIAGAAAFLASADADFVTGEVLSVDGGITHAFS
ncbi:glucose 1-dehydrogenase [Achromobacter sp. GG226]|uniref:SDR family NAD(P)-dependent oxidoreductase n=1 Tax=Verticiella alkaliphila TaxID=2779529 RepID=UPI001C0B26E1|nr:glucose 1-dehydrogenase [Verticiella sp. GG226]MBU4610415.1 glucose 1-dehydrogenase [Verticiella sp. GG226]